MQQNASEASGGGVFFSDVSEESKGFNLIQPDPPGEGVHLEWGDGFLKGGFGVFLTSWPRNFLQNSFFSGLLSALLYEGTWHGLHPNGS